MLYAAIPLAFAFTLYFSVPLLAKPVLQYYLSPYAIKVIRADITEWNIQSWKNFSINFGQLRFQLENGIEFSFEDIKAQLHESQYKFDIAKLQIDQHQTSTLLSTANEYLSESQKLDLRELLPGTLLSSLPDIDLILHSVELIPYSVFAKDLHAQIKQATLHIQTTAKTDRASTFLPLIENGNYLPIDITATEKSIILSIKTAKTEVLNKITIESIENDTLTINTSLELNIAEMRIPNIGVPGPGVNMQTAGNQKHSEDIQIQALTFSSRSQLTTPLLQSFNLHALTDITLTAYLTTQFRLQQTTTVKGSFEHSLKLNEGEFSLHSPASALPFLDIQGDLLNLLGESQKDNPKQHIAIQQHQDFSLSGKFNPQNKLVALSAILKPPTSADKQTSEQREKKEGSPGVSLAYKDKTSNFSLGFTPQFSGDLFKPLDRFNVNIQLAGTPSTFAKIFTKTFAPELTLDSPKLNFDADLEVNLTDTKTKINIKEQSKLSLNTLVYDTITLAKPEISLAKQGFEFTLDHQNYLTTLSPLKLRLAAQQLEMTDLHTASPSLTMSVSAKADSIDMQLESTPLDIFTQTKQYYVPPLLLSTKIQHSNFSPSNASFSLANICRDPILQGQWSPQDDSKSSHFIQLNWEQRFSSNKTFRKWLNTSMPPLDFTKGEFKGNAAIVIDQEIALKNLNVNLVNAGGVSQFGTFSGVQLQLSSIQALSTSLDANPAQHYALQAQVDSLETGVSLEELEISSEFFEKDGNWYLALNKAEASVFGGKAFLATQELVLNDDISVKVVLENLDLAKLVNTQQMQGLITSGKISGYIPIHYRNEHFIIDDGRLKSVEQGKIQYDSPLSQSPDLNQQLKLTLDILKDFQYSELSSNVAFEDDELKFSSHIAGRNPKIENGRPVELNLNTDIGLAGAFKIMRIQAGIEEKLEKFVNQKMNPTTKQYYCEQ
ncbi:hypothetical protein TDB9533_03499 [Thalassocella blandensis]|nr:hypothetical protein TDB9533_03499 [Thalassocella blandensis]